ncbi:hypothetical protein ABFX02_02G146700 [Erythranthe guttata]
MDVYAVDDLLDLPSDDFFASSSSSGGAAPTAAVSDYLHHHPSTAYFEQYSSVPSYSTDFSDVLSVPTEDAAELEWLSTYMDDSFVDFPAGEPSAAASFQLKSAAGFHGRARSKRSRPSSASLAVEIPRPIDVGGVSVKKEEGSFVRNGRGAEDAEVARRCTHCASEKTPQWRTGPLGPKTLCNACGVRYKSGRLVPEYRPAASPTFVLTQHSNSHRKVLELRRQKEMLLQQQQEAYGRHFRVC